MAFCGKCGSEIGNDNVFCPKCGALLEQQNSTGSENTQQPNQQYTYSQQPSQQYNPQSNPYNHYGSSPYQTQKPVDTTGILIWSILTALFCCTPLGIAGIVFSVQANKETTNEGAEQKLKNAKLMCIIGDIVGGLIFILALATGLLEAMM